MRKVQLSIDLDLEIFPSLETFAKQQRKPKSPVAEAAITSFLTADDSDTREAAITKRLDRLVRVLERLERNDVVGGRPGAGCRGKSDRAHTKADRSIRLDPHQRRDSVAQPAMSQIVPAALVPIEREFRLGQRQWHFIDFDRQIFRRMDAHTFRHSTDQVGAFDHMW